LKYEKKRIHRRHSKHDAVKGSRKKILRGLSLRQRAFVREKILGSNDREAALAAGYSQSVSENTKQKIWSKPQVRDEFARLRLRFDVSILS
jgi:hypothetical protein